MRADGSQQPAGFPGAVYGTMPYYVLQPGMPYMQYMPTSYGFYPYSGMVPYTGEVCHALKYDN